MSVGGWSGGSQSLAVRPEGSSLSSMNDRDASSLPATVWWYDQIAFWLAGRVPEMEERMRSPMMGMNSAVWTEKFRQRGRRTDR